MSFAFILTFIIIMCDYKNVRQVVTIPHSRREKTLLLNIHLIKVLKMTPFGA
ncbi:hypothetical protein GCM10007876_20340 [Litoribrevibacter albus]|uniref:Uncharacterized protein n=1 Tax=Litoribrevibacter albus TaxID=1473156 RepID=A0AA37W6E7_9GAMM|nr:hypothetical protein GCM10007876_20340 [Litoribrevibacter albus]